MGTIIRCCSTLSSLGFPHLLRFRFCCSPFCWQYPICSQSLFFHFSFTAIRFPVSAYPFVPRPATCAGSSGEAPWGRQAVWRGSEAQQGQEETRRCLVRWVAFHTYGDKGIIAQHAESAHHSRLAVVKLHQLGSSVSVKWVQSHRTHQLGYSLIP